MSTGGSGSVVPPVVAGAVAGDATEEQNLTSRTTDDGVPVGAADAAEDARRSGADIDDDSVLARPESAATPDETDDGVPVGRSDAEADRLRTQADNNG